MIATSAIARSSDDFDVFVATLDEAAFFFSLMHLPVFSLRTLPSGQGLGDAIVL
jgi:hypothetical protein